MLRENSIVLMLKYLNNLVVKRALMNTGDEGCKLHTNGWLLGYLFQNKDKEIYQKDIETAFHMPRSTVSNLVKNLEKDGLITRVSGIKDTRLKRVCVTEKAEAINHEINQRLEATEKLLRSGIDPEDMEVFLKVARQIAANLHEHKEKESADFE